MVPQTKQIVKEWFMTEFDIYCKKTNDETNDIDLRLCKAKTPEKIIDYIYQHYNIHDSSTMKQLDQEQVQDMFEDSYTKYTIENSDCLYVNKDFTDTSNCEWKCTTNWTYERLYEIFEADCLETGSKQDEWTKEWKLQYNGQIYSIYQLNGEQEWEFSAENSNTQWKNFYHKLIQKINI